MMKKQPFTMVEILAVIAIIIILIGILFPTVGKVMENARKSKAQAMVTQLKLAITQYKTTYNGVFPFTDPSGTSDILLSTAQYQVLLDTLTATSYSGSLNQNHVSNPRRVKFLDIDTFQGDVPYFRDPWENNIQVAIDVTYDEEIEADKIHGKVNASPTANLRSTLAIWSMGPDGQSADDTSPENMALNEDNVSSWKTD